MPGQMIQLFKVIWYLGNLMFKIMVEKYGGEIVRNIWIALSGRNMHDRNRLLFVTYPEPVDVGFYCSVWQFSCPAKVAFQKLFEKWIRTEINKCKLTLSHQSSH